jgi:hypothetical protein
VRAFDPEGADVRASIDVYVAPKGADYNVQAEIFGMDVQHAVGSNDPGVLATTGSLLGTLTSMAKGGGNSGKNRRRLLQEGGAVDPADDSVDETVRLKVMQLLAALSSSSASNLMDAATMRQVRAAAAALRQCCWLLSCLSQPQQTPTASCA